MLDKTHLTAALMGGAGKEGLTTSLMLRAA